MGILEVIDKMAETAAGNTGCPVWAQRQLAQEYKLMREWVENKAIPAVEAKDKRLAKSKIIAKGDKH